MTIKELYEFAKVNGLENLPFRYGYVDDDGTYRPHDFDFADFEYDAKEVTMLFSKSALKALVKEMADRQKVVMEYAGPGDQPERGVYRCSHCGFAVLGVDHDCCPGCGEEIKEWR